MKRLEWTKFFTQSQVKYIQGAFQHAVLKALNNNIGNKARTVQKSLDWIFDIKKDTIEFPFLILGYTPYHKLIVLQGDEALAILNLFRPLDLYEPPKSKEQAYILGSQHIFTMIKGFKPLISELKHLWNDENGLVKNVKDRLHLVKGVELFPLI